MNGKPISSTRSSSAKERAFETSVLKQNLLKLNTGNKMGTDPISSVKRKICPQSSIDDEQLDANKAKRRKQTKSNEVCSSEEIQSKKVIRPKSNKKEKDLSNANNKESVSNSTFSDIVALNCRLTNEILEMKKSLFQKTDALSQLEKSFHEKSIECIDLKSKISEHEINIKSLENIIESTKAEQFCDDLILFDDAKQKESESLVGEISIATSVKSGTNLIKLMSDSMSANNDLVDDIFNTIPASVQHNAVTVKESELIKSVELSQNTGSFSWSLIE